MRSVERPRGALWLAYGVLGVTMTIWASAFAGLRVVLRELDPLTLTSLRMVIASLAMLVVGLLVRVRLPQRQDWPLIALAGLSGFTLYHTALNFGLVHVSAGLASFLIATIPLWTALLAKRYLGERLSPWAWAGLLVSMIGVAALSLQGPGRLSFEPGALLVLLAALLAGVNITSQKRLLGRYSALELSIYATLAGCAPFFLYLPARVAPLQALSGRAWLVTLWLGLGPIALGYYLSNVALSILPASRSAQMMLLVPPLASLMAWIWIDERPGLNMLVGGLMILSGVAMSLKRSKPKPMAAAPLSSAGPEVSP